LPAGMRRARPPAGGRAAGRRCAGAYEEAAGRVRRTGSKSPRCPPEMRAASFWRRRKHTRESPTQRALAR
jgi:hypothetical protein